MIDQARIDKAVELILGGMMYKDVAAELGVSQFTISQWSKKGLIPPSPIKKRTSNHGKVRYYEPLPALTASQRLDGSPIVTVPEKHEEKEEKEPMTFEGVVEAPVVEIPVAEIKKPAEETRIRLKLELVGDYTTVRVIGDEVTVSVRTDTEHLSKREAIALLMDISDELEATINLPEMSL